MMSLSHEKKYLIVCYSISFLVINAVSGISLDYYFGNDEPLRSAGNILVKYCGTITTRYHCYQKCGLHHACLSGQCFCVEVKASSPEEDEDLTEEESSVEDKTGEEFFDEDEEDALEPPSYDESNNVVEEFEDRLALRHHIAHFCSNLGDARACIRKCMKHGLPAFCGKDHRCNCGHNYENTEKDPKIDPDVVQNQFKDLYEKYFGPQTSNKRMGFKL